MERQSDLSAQAADADRVVAEDGSVIYTRDEIKRGRQVWQSMGGMQLGTLHHLYFSGTPTASAVDAGAQRTSIQY